MARAKRARKGGEVGLNGEFYEGGKFLPSTRLPKRGVTRSYGSGRVLIEPGVLAEVPEGRRAIFPRIGQFVVVTHGRACPKYPAEHPAMESHWPEPSDRAQFRWLIEKFNEGIRHFGPADGCPSEEW